MELRPRLERKFSEAASILANKSHPGPFSGAEANWQGRTCVHTIKLFQLSKDDGWLHMVSWELSLAFAISQAMLRNLLDEC